MSQDLILKGSFRVKPGSQAAFDKLVDTLCLDDPDGAELDADDMVLLHIDENVNVHHVTLVDEALYKFVTEHSVLGAATLQTGDSPAEYATYGKAGMPHTLAQRDYFTKQRDDWQQLLDSLEPSHG